MDMHNPPHPGETLLEEVIPALAITITEMARRLGLASPKRPSLESSTGMRPSARILP